MLRHLKQIQHPKKPRHSRQPWRYIRKPDRLNRIHLNLTLLHAIPPPHAHTRTHPDANGTGNLSPSNSLTKPLGKHHVENLLQRTRTTSSSRPLPRQRNPRRRSLRHLYRRISDTADPANQHKRVYRQRFRARTLACSSWSFLFLRHKHCQRVSLILHSNPRKIRSRVKAVTYRRIALSYRRDIKARNRPGLIVAASRVEIRRRRNEVK
jgi:hypothetical protein